MIELLNDCVIFGQLGDTAISQQERPRFVAILCGVCKFYQCLRSILCCYVSFTVKKHFLWVSLPSPFDSWDRLSSNQTVAIIYVNMRKRWKRNFEKPTSESTELKIGTVQSIGFVWSRITKPIDLFLILCLPVSLHVGSSKFSTLFQKTW